MLNLTNLSRIKDIFSMCVSWAQHIVKRNHANSYPIANGYQVVTMGIARSIMTSNNFNIRLEGGMFSSDS